MRLHNQQHPSPKPCPYNSFLRRIVSFLVLFAVSFPPSALARVGCNMGESDPEGWCQSVKSQKQRINLSVAGHVALRDGGFVGHAHCVEHQSYVTKRGGLVQLQARLRIRL